MPYYQIPFACVPCDFKTGIRKKLDRHLESPNHREKVDLKVESVSTLIFQTPHYIVIEQDLVKLSKEVGDTSAEEEDIRSQLLRTEPIQLTPTVRETVGSVVTHESKETQTEQVPGKEDRIEKKLDELKSEVAEALTNMFQYIDQL